MDTEFFHFGYVIALVILGIALTVWVFRKRLFDRGYRKGQAANPDRVRRENPPDEWSSSR
jgi:cbb3-type cytochrome oxidase subunit 3